MKISIIGLTITSSWGNGHATTYRSLVKGLHATGHEVTFYERDVQWYYTYRDLENSPHCRVMLYSDIDDLKSQGIQIINSDLVIVGSFVPEGILIGQWIIKEAKGITAFYDIDTPVTLTALKTGDCEYLSAALIPEYDVYLSISGGRTLQILENDYGSPKAVVFPCSVDEELYYPEPLEKKWDLGYLGTYSKDRQPPLEEMLLKPAAHWKEGRFAVAGSSYPADIRWPENVERMEHIAPALHRDFYNRQRFTLNVTRKDMVKSGYSPSVRIFEAAACGVPIISDEWEGLEQTLNPGEEILISSGKESTLHYLTELPEEKRIHIGASARKRILKEHTSVHRARQLELYIEAVKKNEKFPGEVKRIALNKNRAFE